MPIFALAGLLFTGCDKLGHDHDEDDDHAKAASVPAGLISYSEKSGLHVPPEMARRIGLKLADAEERKLAAQTRFTAQVFHASRSNASVALAHALLPRADAEQLRTEQMVKVQADGAGEYTGRIASLHRELEPATGLVEAQLEIADASGSLAAGRTVTVIASGGEARAALSVPRAALNRNVEGWFVYAVSGEHFVRTAVQVGAMDDAFAAITDGLHAGDRVAAEGSGVLWLTELKFTKAGAACCPVEKK